MGGDERAAVRVRAAAAATATMAATTGGAGLVWGRAVRGRGSGRRREERSWVLKRKVTEES